MVDKRLARRELLYSGVAMTSLGLAGCGSSTTENPGNETEDTPEATATETETSTETPPAELTTSESFDVTNLAFTVEKPQGYREYENRSESAFPIGARLWMYYELPGLTAERTANSDDNTEYGVEFVEEITVVKQGEAETADQSERVREPIEEEDELNRMFRVRPLDLEELGVTVPRRIGEQTDFEVRVRVTDEVSGSVASTSGTVTIGRPIEQTPGEFGVSNFAFCAEEPAGFRDFDRQPDKTYRLGESIWVYFEVDGLSYLRGAEGREVDIEADFIWGDPSGGFTGGGTSVDRRTYPPDANLSEYFMDSAFATNEDDPTGTYSVRVILSDGYGGERLETTREFTVTR